MPRPSECPARRTPAPSRCRRSSRSRARSRKSSPNSASVPAKPAPPLLESLRQAYDSGRFIRVSSLRTSQSSGKKEWWIRRPITSTGVPCVPTTSPPIVRCTTLKCLTRHTITLVELDQLLGELVQLLELAAACVDLGERKPGPVVGGVERLAERLRDAAQLAEARRVEAAAVTEHLSHLGVLPRRHVLEHVERGRDDLEAVVRAPEEADRPGKVVRRDQPTGLLGLVPGELQPDLRRLVHRLEQELVAVHPLVRLLLQREQRVGA